MPNMSTCRPASSAALMPTPDTQIWGVVLNCDDGISVRDYRITVEGAITVFNWAQFGAESLPKPVTHTDAVAANEAARKKWAEKEAQGYWPVTGVLTRPTGWYEHRQQSPCSVLLEAYRAAMYALDNARRGARLVVAQTPSRHAGLNDEVLTRLTVLSASSRTGPTRRAASRSGC